VSQIEFDEGVARSLERLYQTDDVLRRRALVLGAAAARPGDAVLDVGCGPGFYVADLAGTVGSSGRVVGVDSSAQMLAIAARRTSEPHVEFHEGVATSLPIADGIFDRALCVQVLEYVNDATAALAELRRTLRPGGRLVVWDVDWSSVSWHSRDPDRMARVLAAWDVHLVHAALPQTLYSRFVAAGFTDIRFEGHVFATAQLSPQTYGGALVAMLRDYLRRNPELVSPDVVGAWHVEQQALDDSGEFFFSVVQYCFTAERGQ